jgi:hypothetical protein
MADIRISAANLARIKMEDKYLLVLNRNRLKNGHRVYTPFGGAIEFQYYARPYLGDLGVRFEDGSALRFALPQTKLAAFESWFYLRQERENTPFRELQEELVREEGILPELLPNQVTAELLWAVKPPAGPTDRVGQEGILTQRYLEIFEVTFVPGVHDQLIAALAAPQTKLRAVTLQEILAGKTNDDATPIGSICRYLLSAAA